METESPTPEMGRIDALQVRNPMPARKPRPPNEKPQRERFIEAAREHGASEDPEEFERIFRRVVKPPQVPVGPKPALGKKAG